MNRYGKLTKNIKEGKFLDKELQPFLEDALTIAKAADENKYIFGNELKSKVKILDFHKRQVNRLTREAFQIEREVAALKKLMDVLEGIASGPGSVVANVTDKARVGAKAFTYFPEEFASALAEEALALPGKIARRAMIDKNVAMLRSLNITTQEARRLFPEYYRAGLLP